LIIIDYLNFTMKSDPTLNWAINHPDSLSVNFLKNSLRMYPVLLDHYRRSSAIHYSHFNTRNNHPNGNPNHRALLICIQNSHIAPSMHR